MKRFYLVAPVLFIQLVCAFFFIGQILTGVFGMTVAIDWALLELIEIGAAVGLMLGVIVGTIVLKNLLKETELAQNRLAAVSGAFMDLISNQFKEWSLTKAEADVAMFLLKGMSSAEIAALRGSSEGTVKAQTNAIYRKAGVSSRGQFVSLFIDDLLQDELTDKSAA